MDKEKPNEPSTVDDILQKIQEKAGIGEYLYRGEPEHYSQDPYYGKVSSKLYRDFLERGDFDVEAEHFDIEVVQEAMLSAARRFFRKTVQDFEILAEIQRYGGKTNFIDFTEDYLVALFMACDSSPCKNGRVILEKKELISSYIEKPYEPINRVIAQKKVWLHKQEWEKAKADLTGAKDMDVDIVALFHNDYQSVPDFEKQIGVKLPDDISAMLMQQEEKTRI